MKKIFQYTLYTLLLSVIVCACGDDLDVQQVYGFDFEVMPVPKKIAQGETVEIRCEIIPEGVYSGTSYKIRMFQYDGKGSLMLDNGTVLQPNDMYRLDNTTFKMYFTAHSAEAQSFDVFIIDSHNQIVQKTFSFQNDSGKDEEDESTETT